MEKKMFKLTNPQESIWLINKFYENTSISNLSGTLIMHKKVNFDILTKAINIFIEKNDAMRICFELKDGKPLQYVSEYTYQEFPLYLLHTKKELPILEKSFTKTNFNIFNSCLYNFRLIKLKNGQGGFNITIHHLISDAWSMSLVANQIVDIYSNLLKNEKFDIEKKPSYLEYIENEEKYFSSSKCENDRKFWEDNFDTCPSLVSLCPKNTTSSSPIATRKIFSLNNSKKIMEFCKKNNISVFTFLITIYSIYLHRISGNNEIIIGSPILNRNGKKEKETFGLFINTLPLKIQIDDELNFVELAQTVYKNQFSVLRHHKYPYYKMLDFIKEKYNISTGLFDMVISYQNARDNSKTSEIEYSTNWPFNGYVSNNLDIHIYDMDDTGILKIFYDYRNDLFTEEDITDIHTRILFIIDQIINTPNISLKDLEIITKKEKNDLLYSFNKTKFNYNKNKTIIELFEKQVKQTPNKIAVAFGDSTLTYKELNQKANKLAHFLRENYEISRNTFIGIMLKRSLNMAVGLLAIIKSGGAYVPIDPDYPEERISYMLEDSGAKILLVDNNTSNIYNQKEITQINLDDNSYLNCSSNNLNIINKSEDLLYTIYTSGSTGKPKGVMLTHKNVHNYICGLKNVIDFSHKKVIVSVTTICFDIFVTEFWGGLLSGMTVVIANEQEQNIAFDLCKLCKKYNVNIIQTTPSRFNILLEEDSSFLENISDLLVGGEALPKNLLLELNKFPNLKIFNMYGPTETTVWSTIKENPSPDNITIGKPIANTQVYILDDNYNLLPPNIPGNLYIGGDGVSKGYHNRPDLNESVFIKSPFNNNLLYNTKDLAYIQKDGEIVHLGRSDFQVKVHGFRIELGEIENAIIKYPEISNAVVLLQNDCLNAFIVSNKSIDKNKLLAHLMNCLPHYMIPKNIEQIEAIPLTPNGKVDRKNKIFNKITKIKTSKIAPRNKTEELLYKAIKDTLNLEVGVTDNLFEYGVDSLMIIKLVSALYFYNINIGVQDFYDNPSIEKLSQKIKSEKSSTTTKNSNHIENISKIQKTLKENINNKHKNILLTGVTGFLGIHVLDKLLSLTKSNIYCLMRGKDGKSINQRLLDRLDYYFPKKYNELIDKRIFIIDSDITDKNFGLKEEQYSDLGKKISCVIHCAADVRHYGDYNLSEKINVHATKNIIDFCLNFNIIMNHISTLTVSGYGLVKVNYDGIFDEDKFYINQNFNDNIYVKTKFLAEEEIFNASKNGLIANIYRIGNLTNRFSDYKFQFNSYENAFINKLRAIKELKMLPESFKDYKLELTPVDLCAESIVRLSIFNGIKYNINIYHLFDENYVSMKLIADIFKNENINIEYVSNKVFEEKLANNFSSINVLPEFFDQLELKIGNNNSKFDFSNVKTSKVLSKLDFKWPEITKDYLEFIIRRL